jgi:hypothetical protein
MKLKFNEIVSGAFGAFGIGEIAEVPDDNAKDYIRCGFAVALETLDATETAKPQPKAKAVKAKAAPQIRFIKEQSETTK